MFASVDAVTVSFSFSSLFILSPPHAMSTGKQYKAIGVSSTISAQLTTPQEDVWKRTDKVNAELFTLTYGALVVQLIKVS